ncbi:MAG: prepilin-type N-terminal cleavage/methylation domain-containing protein [Tepidisphaeraceae bacterium]|jgi:prepilin-type N-terminal cleavage/methylation domain-containing protein
MFDRSFHHRHIGYASAAGRAIAGGGREAAWASVGGGGFTLIELLMVMIIISILTALVAPKLAGFAAGRGASYAATQIVALARYGRAQAIGEGRIYRLNVDPTSRPPTYWLTAQSDGQEFAPATGDYGKHYGLPDGVSMQTDFPTQKDGTYVAFMPTGRVDFDATTAPNASASATNGSASFSAAGGATAAGPTVFGTGTLGVVGGAQSAQITLIDQTRASFTISCGSASELFHIVQPGETP